MHSSIFFSSYILFDLHFRPLFQIAPSHFFAIVVTVDRIAFILHQHKSCTNQIVYHIVCFFPFSFCTIFHIFPLNCLICFFACHDHLRCHLYLGRHLHCRTKAVTLLCTAFKLDWDELITTYRE